MEVYYLILITIITYIYFSENLESKLHLSQDNSRPMRLAMPTTDLPQYLNFSSHVKTCDQYFLFRNNNYNRSPKIPFVEPCRSCCIVTYFNKKEVFDFVMNIQQRMSSLTYVILNLYTASKRQS